MATTIHIPARNAHPHIKPHRERTRSASDLFTFIATTGVIFAVTFAALNFGAFSKQLTYWLGTQTETTALASDVLTTHTDGDTPTPLATLPAAAVATALPDLTLDIAPISSYVMIPRLAIRAPILEAEGVQYLGDWGYIEKQIQATLQKGVVHFPGTAEPGSRGNAFLTGHSSYYPWDPGRYKDIFALLPKVEVGDDIIVYHDQQRYTYRVHEKHEVSPKDVDVLAPTDDHRLTLMTCTPVGTALRRLIVTAQLIDDAPTQLAVNR